MFDLVPNWVALGDFFNACSTAILFWGFMYLIYRVLLVGAALSMANPVPIVAGQARDEDLLIRIIYQTLLDGDNKPLVVNHYFKVNYRLSRLSNSLYTRMVKMIIERNKLLIEGELADVHFGSAALSDKAPKERHFRLNNTLSNYFKLLRMRHDKTLERKAS